MYVTQKQIQAVIPPNVLNDALDDDKDGAADPGVLDNVIATAGTAVDGYLSGLYPVPFSNPPAVVKESAFVFACEAIYLRRNIAGKDNPYTERANFYRERLQKIGDRQLPLDAATPKAFTPGAAIVSCNKINKTTT